MPQRGTPYLIPFGKAGMVSHPNRWKAQAGELLLAENAVVENDLLQKEPAATYYAPSTEMVDALNLRVTWGMVTNSVGIGLWYAARSGAFIADTVITGSLIPGNPWVVSLTAGAPVGALHAVRVSQKGGTGVPVSIRDSRGNVYTKAAQETGTGLIGQIWVSILTTALQVSDTLLIDLTDPTADVNVIASAVTGAIAPLELVSIVSQKKDASNNITWGTGHSNRYPIIGIQLLAAVDVTTATFTNADSALTHSAVVTTGAHTLAALASSPFVSGTVLVAQTEWTSDEPDPTPGGTVSVTRGSRIVTGTGSSFPSHFRPGDSIIIGGERKVVDSVESATSLTTINPWENTYTNVPYIGRAGPVIITVVSPESATTATMYRESPTPGAHGLHGDLTGVTSGPVGTSLAKVRRGRFVVGGKEIAANPRKLFYFNGIDPIIVRKGDSDALTAITKPAADWGTVQDATKQPINGIVHQDALMAFGNLNDPHRLYISNPADHEDFQTVNSAMSIRIASNVGNRLYGAAQFQGVLFLWKYPNGIFYLDDTPIDRLTWGYRIRSMALGCAPSPHAVLATDDDVIFCDAQGHFHLLSAVATLGGTRDSDVTRALGLHRWTEQNIDVSALERLVSVYDDQTKTAWFGLRSTQGTAAGFAENDLIIRWDFSLVAEGGPPRMTTSREWMPNSLCLKHRDFTGRRAVFIGDVTNSFFVEPGKYGRRTVWDFVTNAEHDYGIALRVELPELEFGDAAPAARARRKAFRSLEVIAQTVETPEQQLTVAFDIDGVHRQTLAFPQRTNRRRLHPLQVGDGYAIAPTLTIDGSVAGDVPLVGLIVYYELLGTDNSRKS